MMAQYLRGVKRKAPITGFHRGIGVVNRILASSQKERVPALHITPREQRYYSVFSPRLTHGDAAVLKVQSPL